MDSETLKREHLQTVTLIGAIVLLWGIVDLIYLCLRFIIAHTTFSTMSTMSTSLPQMIIDVIVAFALVFIGISLLKHCSWARRTALAVLAIAIVWTIYTLIISCTMTNVHHGHFYQSHLETIVFGIATAFLSPRTVMILFLAMPDVQAEEVEPERKDWLSAITARLMRLFPATLSPTVSFIALLLIMLGINQGLSELSYIQSLYSFPSLMFIMQSINILVALGSVFSGIALLRSAVWARPMAICTLIFTALATIFSFVIQAQMFLPNAHAWVYPFLTSLGIDVAEAIAFNTLIIIFLLRVPVIPIEPERNPEAV